MLLLNGASGMIHKTKKNKNTDADASNIVLGVTNQNYMGRK